MSTGRSRSSFSRRSRLLAVILVSVAGLLAAACSTDDGEVIPDTAPNPGAPDGPRGDEPTGGDQIRIEVVSSQPDRISGSEARIRVTLPAGVDPSSLEVKLGDTSVTSSLLPDPDAERPTVEGVVHEMVEGNNVLSARADGLEGVLRLRVWPRSGPIISGPQAPLLVCTTEDHGLGPAADADCAAPTRVEWSYIDTEGALHPLEDPADLPPDIARTDLGEGPDPVPMVVRTERGVINRSVYEIASLDASPNHFDPERLDPIWNGRLVYRYGDGCAATYGQGHSTSPSEVPEMLSLGYAVATATFNTGSVTCDDVLSTETTMMVKERFIEAFGVPELTIGTGAGGGSAQLHLIIQNYPDLLDGAVALRPLPDIATVIGGATDCSLLQRYYRTPGGAALDPAQRAAVNGHLTAATCAHWERLYGSLVDPTTGCAEGIDPDVVYHPDRNPAGVRCTIWDAAANQYGRDQRGHGQRPLDNFGVQYGLEALNAEVITFEQFLDLNRQIGGFDPDGRTQTDRTEADPDVVYTAYQTGRVSAGVGDQRLVPLLEVDLYADDAGDPADRFRAFSLRDRLVEWSGPESVPGLQIWTRPAPSGVTPEAVAATGHVDELAALTTDEATAAEAVGVIDRWLSALLEVPDAADAVTIANHRPDEATDRCRLPDGDEDPSGFGIFEDDGECAAAYPISGDPRTAAGAPRQNDVIKCHLKAVDIDDYDIEITADRYEALLEVFPLGVCDWGLMGVGQTTPSMVDRTYEDVDTPGDLA